MISNSVAYSHSGFASSGWAFESQDPQRTDNSDHPLIALESVIKIASWQNAKNTAFKKSPKPPILEVQSNFSDQTRTNVFVECSKDTDFSWLESIYLGGLNKYKAHELYPLIEKLDELVDQSKFEELNGLLDVIRLYKLSPPLISTFLRTLAPEKENLPGWESLLRRTARELTTRREAPEKWLRGLI